MLRMWKKREINSRNYISQEFTENHRNFTKIHRYFTEMALPTLGQICTVSVLQPFLKMKTVVLSTLSKIPHFLLLVNNFVKYVIFYSHDQMFVVKVILQLFQTFWL